MAFEMEHQNYRYTAAPNPNDGLNTWVRDSLLEVTVILIVLWWISMMIGQWDP